MGWLDKVKQSVDKAAGQAEDMAATGKLRMEIRSLTGKMEDAFKTIGAKVYDLHESGTQFPNEVAALCQQADQVAAEIKSKEDEITKLRTGT